LGAVVLAVTATTSAGAGTITGRVTFRGDVPRLVNVPVLKDHHACGSLVRSEALVVSRTNGGVLNAAVWLEGIGPVDPPATPAEVLLENRGCRFVPHVLALRAGDELAIANYDPVLHNLRAWLPDRRAVLNVVQPTEGQVTRRTMKRAGVMTVTCDTHVHMRGYLLAFDHPYFALTAADGEFRLTGVPAGTHRLTLWHEGWTVVGRETNGSFVYEPPRVLTQEVVVPESGEVRVELELTASP
jgi:plastocyanin